ncbi:MAG: anthranilate phosphoribosyltransferase [Kiritimatiellae bacterium]|nr:anthranilate phosphoribosyltransferase [Kiritimatiellia bacterium]
MILMIDNYDSFTYNLVQMMRALEVEVKVARNDKITIEEIAALKPEAIVLSPGPGTPDSAGVTLEAIKAFAGKIPLLGICLGHQAIAQAFGAKIVHAKSLMHGKTSRIRHDGKGLFCGLDQGFAAMRYHSLAVDRSSLPEELEISAESDDGEIMGLRHKTMPIESLQYHPESIGTPEGAKQLANFISSITHKRIVNSLGLEKRKALLSCLLEGDNLNEEDSEGYFSAIMSGEVGEVELAAFLTALAKAPVCVDMLVGAARAMSGAGVKLDVADLDVVDIVGTGGDGANTFNVSTAAAFIAAGAGVIIAKHGNVASTSKCGSADVLRELGLNLSASRLAVERAIRTVGIGFLFAKEMHPAMRFAAGVRRTLGFRTLFNLLGPLTNPAGAKRQVIGVPDEKLSGLLANALLRLGSVRSLVVAGAGGIDEVSPEGFTFVASLEEGLVRNKLLDVGKEYGERFGVEAIRGGDAKENAKILTGVLRGELRGAYRASAIENAAAAILVGGKAKDYRHALMLAAESIDSGRAFTKLRGLLEAVK